MVSIIDGAVTVAAKEGSKKTINAAIEYFDKKKNLIELRKFKKQYLLYCEKVMNVITLASSERSIFIDDIYVPISVVSAGASAPFEIGDSATLDGNGKAVIIKGLAGQGKSTLLRKLMVNNARNFQRLPIFYELKNYKGGDIEKAIAASLQHEGIKLYDSTLKVMFQDSGVKIYLDAFDETIPEYRNELIDQIKKLMNLYQCHIICTTRPDTEIDSLSGFDVYNVCELKESQIFGIIRSTSSDKDKAIDLCKALAKSHLHNKAESVLKSPILVVLFCISYNLGDEIPSTLSQFYQNIFDTVFHKHDNLKGKVNRVRHWNDNRRIYRDLFDCLCFISQVDGNNSFTWNELSKYVAYAIEHVGEDKSLSDVIAQELKSITNLIINDGYNEYRYVHKSIQEFFAASFIRNLPDEKKAGFYKKCTRDYAYASIFKNTLFFLESIDYHNYYEYMFIPAMHEFLSISDKKGLATLQIPTRIIHLFCIQTQIDIKISKIKSKKRAAKQEIEFTMPFFTNRHDYPPFYAELFDFALEHLKLSIDMELVKEILDNEVYTVKNGMLTFNLNVILKYVDLSVQMIEEALLLSVNVLKRRQYELAVDKLEKRGNSLAQGSYFDF